MRTWLSSKIGDNIFKLVHILMAVIYVLISMYMISMQSGQRLIIAILCAAPLILAVIRHLYLMDRKSNILRWMLPYMEGIIIVFIALMYDPAFGLSQLTLIVMDIAIDYEYGYAFVYDTIGFIFYISEYILLRQNLLLGSKILIFLIGITQFTVYVGMAYLAKMYSNQSRELKKTTAELHTRMIAMEEMAVLKERNRIAGEIHNTVGHQLTTALVQVEAAQLLMEKDPQEAKRRLGIIKEQVKNGLNELRKSIHAISAEGEYENFSEAAGRLKEQVEFHSGINLDCKMDNIEEVRLILKKTLYHVMLESITNAIRHGHCSRARIRLVKDSGLITLTVFNDGEAAGDLKYGYGLNKMKESVIDLGGTFSIKFNEEGWFGIIVELPIYHQEVAIDG